MRKSGANEEMVLLQGERNIPGGHTAVIKVNHSSCMRKAKTAGFSHCGPAVKVVG